MIFLIDNGLPNSLQEKCGQIVAKAAFAWLILATVASLCHEASAATDDLARDFANATIIVEARENACYRFDVFLATSREQQIRGLMHVRHLPEFAGMLFVYSSPGLHTMWMKNTYIPLDILFIRDDGTIANIVTDTEPLSLDSIAAAEPVTYVLELNAGVTEKLRIDTSSRIYLEDKG